MHLLGRKTDAMIPVPASLYADKPRRALTERVGLASDTLPAGGNFHPEEDVLSYLLDQVDQTKPRSIVQLGASMAAPLIARAAGPEAELVVLETCDRMAAVTRRMLSAAEAQATVLDAELQDYDKHNIWYPRHMMGRLPSEIDMLFIDGPGHFAGRTPRWPAGPELFHRLSASGIVVLDDGHRVKEKKTLKRWEEDFPHLRQTRTGTSGGAVMLCRDEGG